MDPRRDSRAQDRLTKVATFLDTNVLVYAVDVRETQKRATSLALLKTAAENREELWISPQVVFEFFTVVTRKLVPPMTGASATIAVEALSSLPIIPLTSEIMSSAVGLAVERRLSIWDASIVSAAVAAGCERLLTEDLSDGQRILGLRIENPYKPGWEW